MASNSSANELLRKVRKIEIRTRALSHQIFAGEYHSAFKGRGMAFSEVREYQYGVDGRSLVGLKGLFREKIFSFS